MVVLVGLVVILILVLVFGIRSCYNCVNIILSSYNNDSNIDSNINCSNCGWIIGCYTTSSWYSIIIYGYSSRWYSIILCGYNSQSLCCSRSWYHIIIYV